MNQLALMGAIAFSLITLWGLVVHIVSAIRFSIGKDGGSDDMMKIGYLSTITVTIVASFSIYLWEVAFR